MKKRRWAIIAFAVIFAAAYVAMGYCIPAFRIKLEADGWTYFLASLQALAPVKLIFSTVLSRRWPCTTAECFDNKKEGLQSKSSFFIQSTVYRFLPSS